MSGPGSGVVAIAAGGAHTCAVTRGGGVLCWGDNSIGQLGDGTKTDRMIPVPAVGLGTGVAAIAAGAFHTCALTAGGAVLCWGNNYAGQLGDRTETPRLTPAAVSGLAGGVVAITVGDGHTCALTTDGAVVCWGGNSVGQLGDGTRTNRLTPTATSGLGSGVVVLAAGGGRTCAARTDGSLLCWGSDTYGDVRGLLGLGTRVYATTPVAVYGFGGAIAAAGVDPAAGPIAGGTTVLISGAYFLDGASVTFGGMPAASVVVMNTETIMATTPSHDPGLVDIVVRNPDGTQAVLAGGFRYEASHGATHADFTGEGRSDILWHHASLGQVYVWPMNGTTREAELPAGVVADTDWQIRSLGDFDGDGKADILWRHATSGLVYLWAMDGSIPLDVVYVGMVDPAYDIVGTGDFNADGKADLVWRHLAQGEVWVWLMDGAVPIAMARAGHADLAYTIRGVGDLDADGKDEIVWHRASGGDVWAWRVNGTTLVEQVPIYTVPEAAWEIRGVADYTGDGQADLLWRNRVTGEIYLWQMNGATLGEMIPVGAVDPAYDIVDTGDYDGDGKADILWHSAVYGGEVWVWLMAGATPVAQVQVGAVPDTGYRIIR